MASNFGQLKRDIFGCTYFVLGDIVIDCEKNGFFGNISAKKFFGNICGNVTGKVFQEQVVGQGITLIGNVEMTENANIRQDLTVCGNLYVDSISPKTANGAIFINGNLDFDKTTINQVCSNVIINSNIITSNIVTANTLNVDDVCANVRVFTRYLVAKDGQDLHVLGNIVLKQSETKVIGDLCGNLETNVISEKVLGNGIDVSANIRPSEDNAYTLGSVDSKWKNLYSYDATICGNLYVDRIEANVVTANNVIGNLCGNLTTTIIQSKGNEILIDSNVNVNGYICAENYFTKKDVVIDFNEFEAGETAFSYTGVTITLPTVNAPSTGPLMIFDSENPSGNNFDLGSPNEDYAGPGTGSGGGISGGGPNPVPLGKIMIISKDGISGNPSRSPHGGVIRFDFDLPIKAKEIHLLDMDEDNNFIYLYDSSLMLIDTINIPNLGDNSFQIVDLSCENVMRIEVEFESSGAIVKLAYDDCAQVICSNIETQQICEKIEGEGVVIKGNTTIEGSISLPKGFGTIGSISGDPYNLVGNVDSPAGCVVTANSLPELSDELFITLGNNYINLNSIVMVNIKSHDGNGCPLIKTVTPLEGEVDIKLKGIEGNISGNLELCYFVIC